MESNEQANEKRGTVFSANEQKGLPQMPVGSHLALFFSDEKELKAIVCPFIEREISENRRIVYIRNAADVEWIKQCIDPYIPDKHDVFLKAWTATDISLRRNGFTPRTLLELLETESEKASDEGLSGLTIMLEVTNVLMQLFLEGRFMDFFISLQDQLSMTTNRFIFQYNLSKLDKRVLHMILTEHPCLLHENEVELNPFYTKKEESTAEHFINHVKSLNLLKRENEGVKAMNRDLENCKAKAEETLTALKNEISIQADELLRVKEENKQKVERIERIQEQLKIDQREITEYKDKETALQEQLKRKIRSIEDLQKNFDIYKLRHSKYEDELKKRDEQIAEQNTQNALLVDEQANLKESLSQKEQVNQGQAQTIQSLKEALDKSGKEAGRSTEALQSYEEKAVKDQQTIESLKSAMEAKAQQLESLKATLEKQTESQRITEQAFEEYKEVHSDLVCEADRLGKQTIDLTQQVEQLETEKQQLIAQQTSIEEEKKQLALEITQSQEATAQKIAALEELNHQLNKVESEKQQIKADYDRLQETLSTEKEKSLQSQSELAHQIDTLQQQLHEAENQLSLTKKELTLKKVTLEELISADDQLKVLLREKEELLNNKSRQVFRYSSLYDEYRQKTSLLNEEKIGIEKKYAEKMNKVSASLKSIKAHHDLDKQQLEEIKQQAETLKETVKKLSSTNESLRDAQQKDQQEIQRLNLSLANLEKQNNKLRDLLKSTNQNCSKIEESKMALKTKIDEYKEKQARLTEKETNLVEQIALLQSQMNTVQGSAKERESVLQSQLEKTGQQLNSQRNQNTLLKETLEQLNNDLNLNQKKLSEWTQQAQNLEKALKEAEEQKAQLDQRLHESENESNRLRQESEKAAEHLNQVNNSLRKTQEKQAGLNSEIEQLKASLKVKEDTIAGQQSQLKASLESLANNRQEAIALKKETDDLQQALNHLQDEKNRVQNALEQQSAEKENLQSQLKQFQLLLKEKEGILSKEMNNIVRMKDEIEHLKYEKLLLLKDKETITSRLSILEKKINAFGESPSDKDLENYRMQQISKSLTNNKPTE